MIREVVHKANREGPYQHKYQDLAKYIAQAFDYLKTIGVPNPPSLLFSLEDDRIPGRILTFQLLKTLRTPPLLEFRVNWQPEAFRAIFFCDEHHGEQVLFFVRALLKSEKNPPDLQLAIDETQMIYLDYLADPEKYL